VTGEHPDAIAYRRTADAFRAGDLELVKALVAPEVVWHVPGEHPMAGTVDGREALLRWLARVAELGF
jgi:ketosteroid isomerase-like protein